MADNHLFLHAADLTTVLDELGVGAAHVVGHDWGVAPLQPALINRRRAVRPG